MPTPTDLPDWTFTPGDLAELGLDTIGALPEIDRGDLALTPELEPQRYRPRPAVLCVNDRAGLHTLACTVIGTTPKCYRIMVDTPTALPPRNGLLMPGKMRLVPRRAIRFSAH